jgi:hypothetical protein
VTYKCFRVAQDLFSLAVVLYEIFTKTITAATVIVMGTPHECSDYAYKVLLVLTVGPVVASGTMRLLARVALSCVACWRRPRVFMRLTGCTEHASAC